MAFYGLLTILHRHAANGPQNGDGRYGIPTLIGIGTDGQVGAEGVPNGFDPPNVAGILTVDDGVTVTINFTAQAAK